MRTSGTLTHQEKVDCTIKCLQLAETNGETKGEIREFKPSGENEWSCDKFCLSKQLLYDATLDFVININILECYDYDGIEIPNLKFKPPGSHTKMGYQGMIYICATISIYNFDA